MPFIKLPDGTVAHIRIAPRRRRRCTFCRLQTVPARLRECDFLLPTGKTCDALMCDKCAYRIGPDKDLCPAHQPSGRIAS